MSGGNVRQKIGHEITELLVVFVFVAPFFLSFEAYRIYLLGGTGHALFEYGTALVNAALLSKIILLGELAGLGKRSEQKALIISTLHKAAMFTILYILFHALEHTIHGLIHGRTFGAALHAVAVAGGRGLLVRALTVFFAFIPFFALLEIRRAMGEEKFLSLFLARGR